MKVLLVHPGTQHSAKLASILAKQNVLGCFVTSLMFRHRGRLARTLKKILPSGKFKIVAKRQLEGLQAEQLKCYPFPELLYLNEVKGKQETDAAYFKRSRRFQKSLNNKLFKEADVVIGFDTSSWIIAEKAKENKKLFILDQTTIHEMSKQRIVSEQMAAYRKYDTIQFKDEKFVNLEASEYAIADKIVVASDFSKATLIQNGIQADKIIINPYGVDHDAFPCKTYDKVNIVQFIFAGQVHMRKGIGLLMDAWKKADTQNAVLNIVGGYNSDMEAFIKTYKLKNVFLRGKMSRPELAALMRASNVFIFPSYIEGFGMVILEAMSSGLPVISTYNTAGPDLIVNEKNGILTEAGNEEQLQKAIQFFIDNPEQANAMGKAANETSREYSWEAYGKRWLNIINGLNQTI